MAVRSEGVWQCRNEMRRPPAARKDGKPWKVNRHPAACVVCSDRLEPGEAIVGSVRDGRIRWVCGPARWDRP